MLTFFLLIFAIAIVGIIAALLFGMSGIVIILVFGDAIIGGFLVYKVIKVIIRKKK